MASSVWQAGGKEEYRASRLGVGMPLPTFFSNKSQDKEDKTWAILLFELVQDGMQAEEALKSRGYECQAVAPPPEVRMGCDLAVLIDAQQQVGIERVLDELEIPYVDVVFPKMIDLRRLNVYKEVDSGKWL